MSRAASAAADAGRSPAGEPASGRSPAAGPPPQLGRAAREAAGPLAARAVTFGYGERPVLEGVSLEVRPGEAVGLVGPNGAGKSTVVALLSRVAHPWSGEVTLDGVPLPRVRRRVLARNVAVLPQSTELPPGFSSEEIVMMGRSPHLALLQREGPRDRRVVEEAMRRTGTWEFRQRPAEELSGGERQRLLLARAFAQEPRFLLLDEPTSSLDLRYQLELLRYVRQTVATGVGALLVLHDLNLAARACDRLVLLARGRVAAVGAPAEVLRAEVLREAYGPGARVLRPAGEELPVVLPDPGAIPGWS